MSRRAAPLPDAQLALALRPVARRVRARYWLEAARAGAVWGLAWAGLALLAARLYPWAAAPRWALVGAAVAMAVALAAAWRGRPGWMQAAAAADALGLKERAVTALELRGAALQPGYSGGAAGLALLVREDALARLATLDARRYPLVARGRPWGHLGLLAALVLVLAVLPNPLREVAAKDRGFLEWVLRRDFTPQVKAIAQAALAGRFPARRPPT